MAAKQQPQVMPAGRRADGAQQRLRIGGLGGLRGLLLVMLFPLALLIAGWSMRNLPNLPLPQTRPGRLPEAHWETTVAPPLARGDFSLVAAGDRLLALGDANGESETAIYDPARDRWEQGPTLPAGRSAYRAAALDGAVFAVGGYAAGLSETGAVDLLAPGADRWQPSVPLPAPRSGHAVVAVGGRLFAIGGNSGGAPVAVIDAYDPATGLWRREATLPTPRDGLAAAILDGRIYILGGRVSGVPTATVEIYDPTTRTWSLGPLLPAPLAEPEATTFNGRIHAVQGDAHFVYDPRSERWLAATPPATPRNGVRIAALGERLYALGGTDPATGTPIVTGERYEPGPPPEDDPFRTLGFDRAGATSVILGLLLTATLTTVMMRAGRHRPAYNRDDPWPEEPEGEEQPSAAADPEAVAPPAGGARPR